MQDQLDGSYLNATADTYTITYDGRKRARPSQQKLPLMQKYSYPEGKVTDEQETFFDGVEYQTGRKRDQLLSGRAPFHAGAGYHALRTVRTAKLCTEI